MALADNDTVKVDRVGGSDVVGSGERLQEQAGTGAGDARLEEVLELGE